MRLRNVLHSTSGGLKQISNQDVNTCIIGSAGHLMSYNIPLALISVMLIMWVTPYRVTGHRLNWDAPRGLRGAEQMWTWERRCQRSGGSYSPSLWTFLRVTEGVEMAEARKLAGRVSAESEVTPRRSFSLNIFLQEGERVNVFVPSC